VTNFISFVASIAELAHGEKSRTQSITQSITHPAYLVPRELKLSLWNYVILQCLWSTSRFSTIHPRIF